MKHEIIWNVDVAKVLTLLVIIGLLIAGYNQYNAIKSLNKVEGRIDDLTKKITETNKFDCNLNWSYRGENVVPITKIVTE